MSGRAVVPDPEPGFALVAHLLGLEEDLMRPEVRASAAEVEARLAPDFVEFGSSGRVYDRDAIVAALAAKPLAAATVEDFRVRLLADDVALVTYRSRRADAADEPVATALRSSIWRRDADGWRMVFHQGTPAG